jgi:predicted AlkP superfamily pyrophosphatase or phosphodiesterase
MHFLRRWRLGHRICWTLALSLALCFSLQPSLGTPPLRQPHLLIVVIAEQFRADYLEIYRNGLSDSGFNRLLREGAVFQRLRFDHLTTLTSPNAAILATGAYPELNGIVGDRWYDRERRKVVAAEEAWAEPYSVAPPNAGPSPNNLVGSTFADELRLASDGQSRVFVVSGRAAPAVMLAGRRPNGCFWKKPDGQFETSPYYSDLLPAWVQEFNQSHSIMRFDGKPWVAIDAPAQSAPLRVIQLTPNGKENFLALYHASPFATDDTFEFAKRAIEAEKLGGGQYTDLLILHLSSPGRLALETGAYSPLMRDMVLRLDRSIADLLGWLDKGIGLNKVSLIFTAAHGIPPLPDDAGKQGLTAGRVAGEEVVRAVNEAVQKALDANVFVEKYIYPFVYFNAHARELPDANFRRLTEAAGEGALRVKGVASYFTPATARVPSTIREKLRRSWHPPRSGDLMLVYEPYFVEQFGISRGTSPGSLYRYDTDVPLILFGVGFRPGHIETEADASSLAPTISALLRIPSPTSATGKVLSEALLPPQPPASAVGPPPPQTQ